VGVSPRITYSQKIKLSQIVCGAFSGACLSPTLELFLHFTLTSGTLQMAYHSKFRTFTGTSLNTCK